MPKQQRVFPDAKAVAAALRPSYPVYCLRPDILIHDFAALTDAVDDLTGLGS